MLETVSELSADILCSAQFSMMIIQAALWCYGSARACATQQRMMSQFSTDLFRKNINVDMKTADVESSGRDECLLVVRMKQVLQSRRSAESRGSVSAVARVERF